MALWGGEPVAVFERQGAVLRSFQDEALESAIALFEKAYKGGRIFGARKRIQVREYPEAAAEALLAGGFSREVHGFAMYR